MSEQQGPPRVLLLCGGRSEEHEVSLASARSVISAAAGRLDVTPLVIDKSGRLLDQAGSIRALESGEAPSGTGTLELSQLTREPDSRFDVVFPILHGPNGEDGAIQGMLRLAGLPFVGTDILGSAVSMDKVMMKTVLGANGFDQVAWRALTRADWKAGPEGVLDRIDLPWPVFAKPANLGSSVGISRAHDRESLREALELAFSLDRRVIVEEGLDAPRELEVGVLGNDDPQVSVVGEVTFDSVFYDYRTKYGEGLARLLIPAVIPPSVSEACRELAARVFTTLDLAGLARVDFFLDRISGRLLLNEVNTIPGFTVTSMYPRLWHATGVDYPALVSRLVSLALERSAQP